MSDVGSGGGKAFSDVINGNPAALIDVQPAIAGGLFASARSSASAVAVSGARALKACARLDESNFKNYGKGHIPRWWLIERTNEPSGIPVLEGFFAIA